MIFFVVLKDITAWKVSKYEAFLSVKKLRIWTLFKQCIINPYKCLLKNASSSIKTTNNKKTSYIITVVLNGIICFSVRFCDKSLLVLKMFFFRKQKGTRVFQWQQDVNVVVIIALSSTKHVSVFLNFKF